MAWWEQIKKSLSNDNSYSIPSNKLAKELGKINVTKNESVLNVEVMLLMEPQGKEAEGWQTGVALDASASMQGTYGRMVEGNIPPEVLDEYKEKKWIIEKIKDGRSVSTLAEEAVNDAIKNGHLKKTTNIIQPIARDFTKYLSGSLDADGGTTVIYWACNDGTAIEVCGDYTESDCNKMNVNGPQNNDFGSGTMLLPPLKYFIERFDDAERGIYIFITDGKINDLSEVKAYTKMLAENIEAGKQNFVKCILIGLGNEIDENQMIQLDNLDTGTEIDIWDHKISKEMRNLIEIFAEVVSENQIVANSAGIYDDKGTLVMKFSDGLPAKFSFELDASSNWFELEVAGKRIKQIL